MTMEDLHKFPKSSLLSAGLSIEAHHRLQMNSSQLNISTVDNQDGNDEDQSKEWNSDDGMS